eukprot:4933379-Pyramimonas_sp.AAC.1
MHASRTHYLTPVKPYHELADRPRSTVGLSKPLGAVTGLLPCWDCSSPRKPGLSHSLPRWDSIHSGPRQLFPKLLQ